ncbi:hypothetical protein [uncultured Mediterranean phage uvDeep-CGR2-KM24-C26]|nr:hypothetical protein [uncultured Mediterranean phage uvDeep-CGR2-KM24-C26]
MSLYSTCIANLKGDEPDRDTTSADISHCAGQIKVADTAEIDALTYKELRELGGRMSPQWLEARGIGGYQAQPTAVTNINPGFAAPEGWAGNVDELITIPQVGFDQAVALIPGMLDTAISKYGEKAFMQAYVPGATAADLEDPAWRARWFESAKVTASTELQNYWLGGAHLSGDSGMDWITKRVAPDEPAGTLKTIGGKLFQIFYDENGNAFGTQVPMGTVGAGGPAVDNAGPLANHLWGINPTFFEGRFGSKEALTEHVRAYLATDGRVDDLPDYLLYGAPSTSPDAMGRQADRIAQGFPELLTEHNITRADILQWVEDSRAEGGGGNTALQQAIFEATSQKIDIYKAPEAELPTVTVGDEDFSVTPEAAFDYAVTQADLVDIAIDGVTYQVPTREALAWLESDRNFTRMSAYEQTALSDAMVRHNTMSAADVGNLAARNAELAESVRSSMATEGQRAWEFGQQFPESVRQFDVTQAGLESRFARELAESQRQANIQAGTQQFGQLTDLIPQFGQLALQQTQQQADILRNPADVGWGMATARGETPWWPQTTQADLLNQSAQQFADIQAFLADQAAGIYPPGAAAPGTLPGFQFDPAYRRAQQEQANRNAIITAEAQQALYDQELAALEAQYGGTPDELRAAADKTAAAQNLGWQQFWSSPEAMKGFDAAAEAAAANPYVPVGGVDPFTQQINLWRDAYTAGTAGEENPFRGWDESWGDIRAYDPDNLIQADPTEAAALEAAIGGLGDRPEVPVFPPVQAEFGAQTHGTQALITGDSSFGRPNPELVLNPTGAPLKVIPMNQMTPRQARLVQFGRLPRAEHGFPHTEAHDWWDELAERAKTDPALRVEMNRMAHQNPYATGPVQNAVTGEWAGGSGPTGSTPGTAQGYNALTGFNYTIPDFPVPPTYTQEGIVERKRAFLPPGPRDVLAGQRPAPLEFGFQMPTPGLMGSLTPNEREAFGSQLASEYNTSLGEVESGIRQRFGQTRRAPRARRARY